MTSPRPALYDAIAGLYDDWSVSVVEDIGFYVDQALASGGPVVELAVGTGRIAVPVARAGIRVIGVDDLNRHEKPGCMQGQFDDAPMLDAWVGQFGRKWKLEFRLGNEHVVVAVNSGGLTGSIVELQRIVLTASPYPNS